MKEEILVLMGPSIAKSRRDVDARRWFCNG